MKNRLISDWDKEGAILELNDRLTALEELMEDYFTQVDSAPFLASRVALKKLERAKRFIKR